ncbi:MAG: hypothetical protein M1833_003985 [Piccolia ochrophora]|nr:MAG: hypothetical protein M1833_003985 [Piccolia ochrophora]
MHLSTLAFFPTILTLTASAVLAYNDNYSSSSLTPSIIDCFRALQTIDREATYSDQKQSSVGTCYLKYATNDAGAQLLSGKVIEATAEKILRECSVRNVRANGSYGTRNCGAAEEEQDVKGAERGFDEE